ncbi:RagB/SusD family nutrient uptake outer membrane protein [Parapedobacter tibetensis]|uniref:RagB/SusD family nutrient uptake outer membrane protein n=1 Tax=Parapedobacter tibetensis TaxID=2972951 RepID=UPI00214DC02D|nr:RagB/SusD family nutrient uptake outer membrane protein [Parapedobacter tibetensis]
MKITISLTIICFLSAFLFFGCSKADFLNQKPQKSLLIPNTLAHFQAMLDADDIMNGANQAGVTPQLGESGSDNFYLLDGEFNANLRPQMQNYYIWSESPYVGVTVADYAYPYEAVLYANTVLEGIKGLERNGQNREQYDNIVGQALFHRAHMFYQLAQVFAPAYNPDTENAEPGIFLRKRADINEKLTRATVEETYEQIIDDLINSVPLLDTKPLYKTRPSKQAAYALLARTFLAMRDYETAKRYADSCLAIQSELHDFNLVNTSVNSPFQGTGFTHAINQEIIFFSAMLSATSQGFPTTFSYSLIDSALYASYHENDLRRQVFFSERVSGHRFRGSYSFRGRTHYFSGLAVDEILLTRAECNARLGSIDEALADLRRLLLARWDEDASFVPYEGLDDQETLSLILDERRKELLYRGLRWTDLRRMNQEGYNVTINRKINGQAYTLPPNDPRWTWPLPPEVVIR